MNNEDDNKKPWSADIQAAMKKLEKFYRTSKASDDLDYCPLCRSACFICNSCPWKYITGKVCGERAEYLGIISIALLRRKSGICSPLISKSKLISLRRFRARELKQWMKHYEEER